jgi:hypothetical protein
MDTNELQVFRAGQGDFSTAEWPIGGICRLEPRDGAWALVTQWGKSYILQRQGLVQMIDECERVLDTELGLPSDPLESLAEVWAALNNEISTRQGCAKSLGDRLDVLADRISELEAK